METIKNEFRPAWRNYWLGLIIAGFLFILTLFALFTPDIPAGFIFLLTLSVLAVIVFRRFSWKFIVDDNRVSRHYGIISRNQQSIQIKNLRSVELSQGIIQRIFRVGNLAFYSAGTGTAEVIFWGILQPLEWRDKIEKNLDTLKE